MCDWSLAGKEMQRFGMTLLHKSVISRSKANSFSPFLFIFFSVQDLNKIPVQNWDGPL